MPRWPVKRTDDAHVYQNEWHKRYRRNMTPEQRAKEKDTQRQYHIKHKDRIAAQRRAHYAENRNQILATNKAYAQSNPDKVKFWDRKKVLGRYGLTHAEYDAMLTYQSGLCEICQQPEKGKRLAVDHDHITGQVRGLLCGKCNGALGWYEKHGPVIANYLIRHGLKLAK